ncbi:hypothetical protein C1X05_04080 [Laceyella sacchari]|uniref:Uncharacterized protein n=1 Tax=Laceyella tengchongensis TaxID=574699 RepID=A0AA45WJ78_9BACL|nr:hypothetical protein [Laceyella tengchongensis]AUS08082.1 hypothetical protein C1X05_04080 [Laceyella sacchari]SMP02448.1 hypothetical protein SAMN06265361_101344 [Laceyella tengchongensis]HWO76087.1 hypothetical protein [Bacillus sp. (in: firmicutes)]
MANDGIYINNNPGQVIMNQGRNNSVVQNVNYIGKHDEYGELKQKLAELIQALETTTEIDQDTKQEFLSILYGPKSLVEKGNCTPRVLNRLNNTLVELGGIVAGSAALGQVVSATMDVVGGFLK